MSDIGKKKGKNHVLAGLAHLLKNNKLYLEKKNKDDEGEGGASGRGDAGPKSEWLASLVSDNNPYMFIAENPEYGSLKLSEAEMKILPDRIEHGNRTELKFGNAPAKLATAAKKNAPLTSDQMEQEAKVSDAEVKSDPKKQHNPPGATPWSGPKPPGFS